MAKENIEEYDFTKDFSEREVYEMYKTQILGNLKQCLGDYVNEECVRVRYNGEVMAYEQNNKLYSSVKLKFEVRTPIGIWKEFVLLITPFNCYFYRWITHICIPPLL